MTKKQKEELRRKCEEAQSNVIQNKVDWCVANKIREEKIEMPELILE